jgi:purine-nucleoside phosphorylase
VVSRVAFGEIPGFPSTSIEGHKGILTLGHWSKHSVLVFEGRFHFYEGHAWETVAAPARLAASLGVRYWLLTNAAGGIADMLEPGSLMLLTDHLEWNRPYSWRRPNRPSPCSANFATILDSAAERQGIELHKGVYAAVTGPCYETAAEIRALKSVGADAVGMSTAREIQAGCDLGMECAAISCITNRATGLSETPLNHEDVLATAGRQRERLAAIFEEIVMLLASNLV